MRYTPGQIKAKIKGFMEQQKLQQKQVAWAVCNLMNATGNFKEPVTIEKLAGSPKKQKQTTPEEAAALLKRLGGK